MINSCVCVCVCVYAWVYLSFPGGISDFPGGSDGKTSAYNVGNPGSIPGSGRSPGEGNGNPLQYSCLENPMDGGAWQATVHGSQRVGQDWTTSLTHIYPSDSSSLIDSCTESGRLPFLLLFNHSVVSDSWRLHGLQHARLPCPSLSPRACSNSCTLSRWCHPTISSSVTSFSCLQSFPAPGSFLMSRLFASGGWSIGVSASVSVLPIFRVDIL